MPTFRGVVFAQTVCTDELRPTGKFLPFTKSDGSRGWMPIKERRTIHHWTWDGSAWLPSEVFDAHYTPATPIPKPTFTPLERQHKAAAEEHGTTALPLRSTVRTAFTPPSRPPVILVSKHSISDGGEPNKYYRGRK
jgi:hypothetical protein